MPPQRLEPGGTDSSSAEGLATYPRIQHRAKSRQLGFKLKEWLPDK